MKRVDISNKRTNLVPFWYSIKNVENSSSDTIILNSSWYKAYLPTGAASNFGHQLPMKQLDNKRVISLDVW